MGLRGPLPLTADELYARGSLLEKRRRKEEKAAANRNRDLAFEILDMSALDLFMLNQDDGCDITKLSPQEIIEVIAKNMRLEFEKRFVVKIGRIKI